MRLLVTIDLSDADIVLFDAYEAQMLSLLPVHAGRREFRLRAIDGRSETHLLHFPTEAAFEAYLTDPRRLLLRPDWEESGARATILPVKIIG
jgi:hypothetical protein